MLALPAQAIWYFDDSGLNGYALIMHGTAAHPMTGESVVTIEWRTITGTAPAAPGAVAGGVAFGPVHGPTNGVYGWLRNWVQLNGVSAPVTSAELIKTVAQSLSMAGGMQSNEAARATMDAIQMLQKSGYVRVDSAHKPPLIWLVETL